MVKKFSTIFIVLLMLVGCTSVSHVDNSGSQLPTAEPKLSITQLPQEQPIASTETAAVPTDPSIISTPTAGETAWQSLPIIPQIPPEMLEVYQRGLASGNDPTHFSKIGDCQNITTYYLAMFDSGRYQLGKQYASLQSTIDHFAGSWQRESLAVKGGMNAAAVQNVLWANPTYCKSGETPLQCELRVYKPSIAIISMEESWAGSLANYDFYMRKIVEYVLSQDVVPILATRAETPTQERQINAIVAQIAADYHVPLWNFWAATAPLPGYGISEDGFHLTGKDSPPDSRSFFDDPDNLQLGWTQRNLTALQAIDAVYRAVSGQ